MGKSHAIKPYNYVTTRAIQAIGSLPFPLPNFAREEMTSPPSPPFLVQTRCQEESDLQEDRLAAGWPHGVGDGVNGKEPPNPLLPSLKKPNPKFKHRIGFFLGRREYVDLFGGNYIQTFVQATPYVADHGQPGQGGLRAVLPRDR